MKMMLSILKRKGKISPLKRKTIFNSRIKVEDSGEAESYINKDRQV